VAGNQILGAPTTPVCTTPQLTFPPPGVTHEELRVYPMVFHEGKFVLVTFQLESVVKVVVRAFACPQERANIKPHKMNEVIIDFIRMVNLLFIIETVKMDGFVRNL
jgi:hypothetical protein